MKVKAPCAVPCVDCPYRKDSPSGLWSADMYDMLPLYDLTPAEGQPLKAFMCHEQNGHLCAGWIGCHGADDLIGMQMLAIQDDIDMTEYRKAQEHQPRVPLFESGKEAAEHGKRDIDNPSERTQRRVEALLNKPAPFAPRTWG